MDVQLLQHSDLSVALKAALICTDNLANVDKYDAEKFLTKMINNEHLSVIEHINYSFLVTNVSRALLQELARHRHISLSVKSTRWALRKFASKACFYLSKCEVTEENKDILTQLDNTSEKLASLIENAAEVGIPNDVLKYYIQESLCTDLVLTVNARELLHIFKLRTSKRALEEFRKFCFMLYVNIPDKHTFMFEKALLGT